MAAPTTAPGPEEPLKTPGGSLPDNDLGIQNVQIRTGRAVIGLEQTAAQYGGTVRVLCNLARDSRVDVLSSRILLRPSDLDRSRRFYRDVLVRCHLWTDNVLHH